MKAHEKALTKMKGKKKEYMGDEHEEEEGTMKEGKGKKDNRTGKDFMNPSVK